MTNTAPGPMAAGRPTGGMVSTVPRNTEATVCHHDHHSRSIRAIAVATTTRPTRCAAVIDGSGTTAWPWR